MFNNKNLKLCIIKPIVNIYKNIITLLSSLFHQSFKVHSSLSTIHSLRVLMLPNLSYHNNLSTIYLIYLMIICKSRKILTYLHLIVFVFFCFIGLLLCSSESDESWKSEFFERRIWDPERSFSIAQESYYFYFIHI